MLGLIIISRPCIPPPAVFPRLRSRSCSFHHVHYPLSIYSHLLHHLYADDTQLFFFYPSNFDWNTSFSHLLTKFSRRPRIHICTNSSQFNLALHLWSLSLIHLHRRRYV